MAATIHQIRSWLDEAAAQSEITHVIVKCDTFESDGNCCYPVKVTSDEDVREVAAKNADRTMEVYAMHLPLESQMSEFRSFHWESVT